MLPPPPSSFRRNIRLGLRSKAGLSLDDTTNVAIPLRADGKPLSLEERLRYLELKTNAHFNFGTHPFFGSKMLSKCKEQSDLRKFGCVPGQDMYNPNAANPGQNCPGLFDHVVCLDHLPKPKPFDSPEVQLNGKQAPCLIYDFGIRKQPQFGQVMAKVFGCEVHAFDPSPVSTKWWESDESKGLRSISNYHFHPYGAGGFDGDLELNEYDWGQVSIIKFPTFVLDCNPKNHTGPGCKAKVTNQKSFTLPVKTLSTIMKELGHEGRTIDILKIDVEGSEFAFLEHMLDHTGGCPDFIEQITVEWHHMPWDVRYGEGSSPSINAIATLLHTCGLKMFWQYMFGGWQSHEKMYHDMGLKDVRYNLASFHREH